MSNYTNTFGGAAKDSAKDIILGAEYDTEYDAIVVAIATKATVVSGPTDTNVMLMDANGDTKDSGDLYSNIPKLDEAQAYAEVQTFTKAAVFSVSPSLPAGSIDTAELASLAVETAKIDADAIDSTKLADNAVNSEHYVDGSIDLIHMSASSVDTSQLVAAAVGRSEIANSVTTSAGSHGNQGEINIALNDWALFPMVHGEDGSQVMKGHSTDGVSASSPRFRLYNNSGGTKSWDVDHRWIIAV